MSEMSEAEYNILLDEANRRVEEDQKRYEEVMQKNFESFLKEEEIPPFKEALDYLNLYEDMKKRLARQNREITCPITNRKAIACRVALKREAERNAFE
jgi:hypothetical protein